jgi:arsenate reductase (thioredoxin)
MAHVLFVCLHNAGRSQMSEALFERAAQGRHSAASAGTTPADRVHPEVVEAMRELGVDLGDRSPKRLTREAAEEADVVVTMGCGDECPYIPGKRYVDWDLQDPKGLPLDQVRAIRDEIAGRVERLMDELDQDGPRPEELVPQGGTWSGLLFDNPTIGRPAALTWTFDFQFGEVERDYGESPVSLTVDWVPLPGADRLAMAGHSASCDTFAEPIECGAYFFEHYRYDAVRLRVVDQAGTRLLVAAEAHGDLDRLGVPAWSVEQWLDFGGMYVQLSDVTTIEEASTRLAEYTDMSGLVGTETGHNFRFAEAE